MATAPPSERENGVRLYRLLVDNATCVLRKEFDDCFDQAHSPYSLRYFLDTKPPSLMKCLDKEQVNQLFGPDKPKTSEGFDISLLYKLLRNICNLSPPTNGWGKDPDPTDHSKQADYERVRILRNKVHGHIQKTAVDIDYFESKWNSLRDVLCRLRPGLQQTIDNAKQIPISAHDQEYYMEKMRNELSLKTPEDDLERMSDELKKNVLVQTKYQDGLFCTPDSKLTTDNIFTNIQINRTPLRDEILSDYPKPSLPVKPCEDLLLDQDTKKLNKLILVTGKAGIGKTFFCQKVARDWANGSLFSSPDNGNRIKFVFSFTFRDLNRFKNNKLSLLELLRRASAGLEIDEKLFDLIKGHPEQVMFILDGFDEYKQFEEMEEGEDSSNPYDPLAKMVVPLLIQKLLKKEIFPQSVILLTSRPAQRSALDRLSFDITAEILGFDEKNVAEFVGKYLSLPLADKVKTHILENRNLLSFCYTPLNCMLVCWSLAKHYEEEVGVSEKNALPTNLTDLYSLVIKLLTSKVHPESKFRSEPITDVDDEKKLISETWDKLSELAGTFYREKKYVFDDSDLDKFNFSDEEKTSLINCGLLICGPGYVDKKGNTRHDFAFLHLTIQEFLAARYFVMKEDLSTLRREDEVVCVFMGGIAGKERNENCMTKLIKIVCDGTFRDLTNRWSLAAKCLQECGDDDFAKGFVETIVTRFSEYAWPRRIAIDFFDTAYERISEYFLRLLSLCNNEFLSSDERFSVQTRIDLVRTGDHDTLLGDIEKLSKLQKDYSVPITCLSVGGGYKCVDAYLPDILTKCSHLESLEVDPTWYQSYEGNKLLLDAIGKGTLRKLTLSYNDEETLTSFCVNLCNKGSHELRSLGFRCTENEEPWIYPPISKTAILNLCETAKSADSKLHELHLYGPRENLEILYAALKDPECKLSSLRLYDLNLIELSPLCEVLKDKNNKLTSLELSEVFFYDFENLETLPLNHDNCRLTELSLINVLLSEECFRMLCELLKNENSRLRILEIIIEAESSLKRVIDSIEHKNCKLEVLTMTLIGEMTVEPSIYQRVSALFQNEHSTLKQLVITGIGYFRCIPDFPYSEKYSFYFVRGGFQIRRL